MKEAGKPLRIIITGATGMVGEGVLHECLQQHRVSEVLVIGRNPCGIQHPKLRERLLPSLFDTESLGEDVGGYDACFFCMGISSLGMKEADYRNVTYDLTQQFARKLSSLNPEMSFCYISGAGTDATEKGRLMWARVKGKTENDLSKLPFKAVYHFRPGLLTPTPGLKNTLSFYHWIGWLIPLVRMLAPGTVSSLKELGQAMIHAIMLNPQQTIFEVKDIKRLAREG